MTDAPSVSQFCLEDRHQDGVKMDRCAGWAWYLPGQAIGPECVCPCHAAAAAALRAESAAWLLRGGSGHDSPIIGRGTVYGI